jgi:UDP-sugar pyrophosphorylase
MLDPLLRTTTEYSKGDENDPKTGFSPFPGNINQLVFRLKEYNEILERTKGIMPEFVNPKYTDASKSVFKSPTRLECMMQDFPTVLEGEETSKVGFTQLDASLCFSPVKNSVEDGKALQEKGLHAGTLSTGEADMYAAVRQMMRTRGCDVTDAEPQFYNGIKVIPGPAIVLKPDVVCCPGEYTIKFPTPDKVKISARSTLIVRGPGVIIESLELDGALIIDVDRGEEAVVRDLVVKNDGWVKITDEHSDNEVTQMRGYFLDRKDVKTIEVDRNSTAINDDDTEPGVEWVVEERNGCSILLSSSSGEAAEGCSIL